MELKPDTGKMAGLRGFCVKDGRIFYDNNYTDFEKRLALLVEQNRDAFTDSDSDTGSSDDAGENMIQMQPNDKLVEYSVRSIAT